MLTTMKASRKECYFVNILNDTILSLYLKKNIIFDCRTKTQVIFSTLIPNK